MNRAWSTLIDLNPAELKWYSFMISLDKYSETCNSVDELSLKMCSEQSKRCKFKIFNMITNKIKQKHS